MITKTCKNGHTLEELISHVPKIQAIFRGQGVDTYLAGGSAADLLASVSIPNHQTYLHKDIDVLIPRWQLQNLAYNSRFLESIGYPIYKHLSRKFDLGDAHFPNLLVLTDQKQIRIDLMGYGQMGSNTGYIPKMTWGGGVDTAVDPIYFTLNPVTITVLGNEITTLPLAELLQVQS